MSASKNDNHSNGKYKVNDIIFPSRFAFSTIESIDRNLRILYSKAPPNSLWPRINYSSVRDDEEEFVSFLGRVEDRINRCDEKVNVRETDDSAFNEMFPGIIDFLYEAYDFENNKEYRYSKKTPEYIKDGFIYLAKRLWQLGINPGEF